MADTKKAGGTPKMTPLSRHRERLNAGLYVPFASPIEVRELGPFALSGFKVRDNVKFKRQECVFTLTVLDGPQSGADFLLTLGRNEIRDRIGAIVLEAEGPIGPLVLSWMGAEGMEGEKDSGFWQFCELDKDGIAVALIDAPEPGAEA
jgi:hypothetical protein